MKVAKTFAPTVDKAKPRLVTIGFSHFSEKARWGLDLSPWATEYYEEVHCPALHLSSTLNLVHVDRIVSWDREAKFQDLLNARHNSKIRNRKEKTGVPKLILPESYRNKFTCLRSISQVKSQNDDKPSYVISDGSSGILKTLNDIFPAEMSFLYPVSHFDEVIELEHMLDTQFAPAVTQWDFANTLLSGSAFTPSTSSAATSASDNADSVEYFINFLTSQSVPLVEKAIFKLLGSRFILPIMIKANEVRADNTAAAMAQIHQTFDQMDALLSRNNPTGDVDSKFLLGTERITAADIAFASFAAAVLFPPQTARFFPALASLSSTFRAERTTDSRTAAGALNLIALAQELQSTYLSARYVLKLYGAQRFRVNPPEYTFLGPVGENAVGTKVGRVVEPRVQ